jgi:hypothetical protein
MTSIGDRISALEQKYPDEANEYTIGCILSRLDDDSLDILGLAARYRETGHTMEETEQYLDGKRKLDQYWRALKTFEQIHKDLDDASDRGEKITPLRR